MSHLDCLLLLITLHNLIKKHKHMSISFISGNDMKLWSSGMTVFHQFHAGNIYTKPDYHNNYVSRARGSHLPQCGDYYCNFKLICLHNASHKILFTLWKKVTSSYCSYLHVRVKMETVKWLYKCIDYLAQVSEVA